LVPASDGSIYGTTCYGAYNSIFGGGWGTLFNLSPNGVLENLHYFGAGDGFIPTGVTLGSDGCFYGTTMEGGINAYVVHSGYGTVFKFGTNGVYDSYLFTNGTDGANPTAALVLASDGNLYGSTSEGGAHNLGTIFKISTNLALTTLYSFTGRDDGANPSCPLVQASDGYLYGMNFAGGRNGYGNLFRVSTNGALSVLYGFADGDDGANPNGGLVQASDGNFYGTTTSGGEYGWGTVFRLSVGPRQPVFQAIAQTNGSITLTWLSAPGARYQLQYTSDLVSGNWNNIGTVLTATGTTLSATDSIAGGPARFYRVALLP
jgi:uncharacterized repeat protein (TIGR03803 family)